MTENATISLALEAKRDAALRELARLDELVAGMNERRGELRRTLADCLTAARVLGVDLKMPADVAATPGRGVKEWLAARLATAGTSGTKTRPLRDEYHAQFGRALHPKTMGMTLYRLKMEGRASRSGHVWFAPDQNRAANGKG